MLICTGYVLWTDLEETIPCTNVTQATKVDSDATDIEDEVHITCYFNFI